MRQKRFKLRHKEKRKRLLMLSATLSQLVIIRTDESISSISRERNTTDFSGTSLLCNIILLAEKGPKLISVRYYLYSKGLRKKIS